MAKTKTEYVCQNCGAKSPKWIGKCNSCGEWNTYVEEVIHKETKGSSSILSYYTEPQKLDEISANKFPRIDTGNKELNRVIGGGLIHGSLVLLGGEPGIGKSTLALQTAIQIKDRSVLYISGEESAEQIKLRAERISKNNSECYILCDTSVESILQQLDKIKPGLVIVDSIQTLQTEYIESSPGSISQVRECTNLLMKYAKKNSIPVILIGHINKEGNLAGPKVLEHIVDTVLQFEGERNHFYRILRSTKNRFGSSDEIGIFEMQSSGLKIVENPSELLISQFDENLSGTSIAATIDGMRPMLIETQALVSSAVYGTPQRSSTGFDIRRLNMLLAVLEKRAGFRLGAKDVFLNIAGGLRVNDPGIDLAIVMSVLSSNIDVSIHKDICFAGELGLSGEIRPVSRIDQRISEAEKLGFKKIMISKYNKKGIDINKLKLEIITVSKIQEAVKALFSKKA